MILVKLHQSEHSQILCLCDQDLIGKNFEEGEEILYIYKSFYKGEEMKENIDKLIEGADIINCVGKESINFLIKKKILIKNSIKYVEGVPHAQIFQYI